MRKQLSKHMGALMVFVLVALSSTLNAQDPSLVLYFSFDVTSSYVWHMVPAQFMEVSEEELHYVAERQIDQPG